MKLPFNSLISALLALAGSAMAATTYQGDTLTLTVQELPSGSYRYIYTVPTRPDGKHEISHFLIISGEVMQISTASASITYVPERSTTWFKFDDLDAAGAGAFTTFTVTSSQAPGLGAVVIKSGQLTSYEPMMVPTHTAPPAVPEPCVILVSSLGIFLLIRRRRAA